MNIYKDEVNTLKHMTHIDNLDSIFKEGLHSHSNPYKKRDISNTAVNHRREARENIYGRKIHDYVPFYFNPRNAMMYKNRDEDIVVLAFSKKLILQDDVLFTDKNASTNSVHFYNNIEDLDKINWNYVRQTSWYGRENEKEIKATMMAEVLVHESVSMKYLKCIYCKSTGMKEMLVDRYNIDTKHIVVKPYIFFN